MIDVEKMIVKNPSDTDILIANYQSIIRVLAGQVRTLELQLHKDAAGCALLQEECAALTDFITDNLVCYEFSRSYGIEELGYLLSAWEKIRKGSARND